MRVDREAFGFELRLTVADVVSQRVGLIHNTYDRDLEADVDYRSLVQKLAYAPMKCAPGQCYSYQNIAFSLIGDVVFAATGKRLRALPLAAQKAVTI